MQTDPSFPMDDFEHVLTQDSPILSWISVPGPDAVQWIGTTMVKRFVTSRIHRIPNWHIVWESFPAHTK